MYRVFDRRDADTILRASEGNCTKHKGENDGHSAKRHFLLNNSDMESRYWSEIRKKNGQDFIMITAFSGGKIGEMADAAQSVLNSHQAQCAINSFFSREGSEGMRAIIHYTGGEYYRMRYVASGGHCVQTMPINCFLMVLDRHDDRPFRLHIQTLFGAVPLSPRNIAILKSQSGKIITAFEGQG
jgi:hypothetical protein